MALPATYRQKIPINGVVSTAAFFRSHLSQREGLMKRTALATIAILASFAFATPAKGDSVSVQQSPFSGFFGINFPIPDTSSGLLIFPGPYQFSFQTNSSTQTNTFVAGGLDVSEAIYGPGGSVGVLGPNGFQLSGTFTSATSLIFTNTITIPGFPVGSVVGFTVTGAFTGSLTDGEPWQGSFGVDQSLCCRQSSSSFLQMSGPVSEPETGVLLLSCAGILALGLLRVHVAGKRPLTVNVATHLGTSKRKYPIKKIPVSRPNCSLVMAKS